MKWNIGEVKGMKRKAMALCYALLCVIMTLVSANQGLTFDVDVGGSPLTMTGFLNQSVYYGLQDDAYDTKSGFNSFVTQALLEATYMPTQSLRFFASGNFNADWAYPIYDSDDEWNDKQFDQSEDRLYIFDDWQDILKEANATWANDKFYVRLGKQIVQWGQMDGYLITNVINPIDQRRGISDVEFENTVIPIWMVRAEYNTFVNTSWLSGFGLQFVLDPSFKFRGNELLLPGNDAQGVWAPNVDVDLGPMGMAHLGSINFDIDEPDDFDPDYFTYGLKARGYIYDAVVELLCYYGRDRDFVAVGSPTMPDFEVSDEDGQLIIHPYNEGYYPRFKFIGATYTQDLTSIKANFLGGVSPVVRLEALYAFDSTYSTTIDTFYKTDEIRAAIGIDWKVKIPFLNAKKYFMVAPQYYYQRVVDYPDGYRLNQRGSMAGTFFDDNHKAALMINTNYYNGKIQPMAFWLYDISNRASYYKLQCAYAPTSSWTYTLGASLFDGSEEGRGFEPLANKDQIYFTIGYTF